MIEIISPQRIKKKNKMITELKNFGLDYFDTNSTLGWNYVLDHVWLYENIKIYLENNKIKDPIIFDVGCGNSPFHNFLENNLQIDIVGIDRPEGFCHQQEITNVDYNVEFLKFNKYKRGSVDIIYWLSAIEHNKIKEIKRLYKRSIHFLKPGGLLLITFPLSEQTSWFQDSQQTNLSKEDAKRVFMDDYIKGDLSYIKKEFKDNYLSLMERYRKRYGHFTSKDPEFVVGGLKQIGATKKRFKIF